MKNATPELKHGIGLLAFAQRERGRKRNDGERIRRRRVRERRWTSGGAMADRACCSCTHHRIVSRLSNLRILSPKIFFAKSEDEKVILLPKLLLLLGITE